MSNTLNLGNGNWAVKKDSLLAYNSENGNFKPLPFDFTRASSATVVNKDGLIEIVGSGKARIDFKDDAKGALLLEPTRSNLLTYSSELNIGTNGTASVTSNTTISPNGALNADTLGIGYRGKSVSATANTYSLSVFVKSEISSTASIYIYDGTYYSGTYDLTTGISTGVGTSMVNYGNGWWRCIITQAIASTISEIGFNSGQVYVWGAQLEQGSYATSLIPTQGSAVTRVADSCNNAGNNQVINSTEGVLYFEGSVLQESVYEEFAISLSDGSSNNRIFLTLGSPDNNYRAYSSGGADLTFQGLDVNSLSKVAVRYSLNNFSIWINGIKRAETLTYAGIPSNTLNNLSFSRNASGEYFFRGNTKDLRVYNTALTDAELILLTTI
jgi:hypothetical protein